MGTYRTRKTGFQVAWFLCGVCAGFGVGISTGILLMGGWWL